MNHRDTEDTALKPLCDLCVSVVGSRYREIARSTCSITPAAARPLTGDSAPAPSVGSTIAHAASTLCGSFPAPRAQDAPRSASNRAEVRARAPALTAPNWLTRRVTGATWYMP